MNPPKIILSGVSPMVEGLQWETETELRLGSKAHLDIVLPGPLVAPEQALIRKSDQGWVISDLAKDDKYPTLVKGTQVQEVSVLLHENDLIQVGRIQLQVTALEGGEKTSSLAATVPTPVNTHIKTSSGTYVKVQAKSHRTWEQALEVVAYDAANLGRQSQQMLTLLRTGYHLCHLSSLEEMNLSVLKECVTTLNAQRGAIVLADAGGDLKLQSVYAPDLPTGKELGYSRTLAYRCFSKGESLLCQDVRSETALETAQSVRRGGMASIICCVLRSPRKKLGILHLDRGPFHDPFSEQDFFLADALAASVSMGIESALLVEQQREEFIQSVTSLAQVVELRDQYTGDHTRRVTDYSLMLARKLEMSPGEIYHIQIGTPLHDIGKIGIDDSILRKPGRLTSDEFEVMKMHTIKGAVILQTMTNLSPMIPIVRHHHERWDGQGYPDGLAKDRIPKIARVVAVADAFDAMTSNRPYRQALPVEQAFEEIRKGAGRHFDPICVEAFLSLRSEIEKMARDAG